MKGEGHIYIFFNRFFNKFETNNHKLYIVCDDTRKIILAWIYRVQAIGGAVIKKRFSMCVLEY